MPSTKARAQEKDLITRLADAGEEAIKRLGEMPGGQRLVDAAHTLRERLEDVQRRLRALDPLERRVTALEKRLAALERKQRQPSRRPRAKS